MKYHYGRQLLIALDQLLNAVLGGWADETLSSRAWRERRTTVVDVIDTLFFWEPDHCRQAYEIELSRLDAPPELRTVFEGMKGES